MARGVAGIDFIIDDKEAHAAIRRMVSNVDDLRKIAWPTVLDAMLDANKAYFASRGNGWQPLTANYAKWKLSHGGGNLLNLTGELQASLTEKGAKWQKVSRSKHTMTLSTINPTAHLHAKGKPKMPARPPLDAESPQVQKAVQDALEKVARQWAADFARGA